MFDLGTRKRTSRGAVLAAFAITCSLTTVPFAHSADRGSALAEKLDALMSTDSSESEPTPAPAPTKKAPVKSPSTTNNAPRPRQVDNAGPGKITVSYAEPRKKALKVVALWLNESKGFDEIIAGVNQSFKVPAVKVVFMQCGEANAFYSSESKQITMCYELFAYLKGQFEDDDELSSDEVISKTVNGGVFFFFHELGHAFVDLFDLPITGREEDAVDDLATLILLEADDDDEAGQTVYDAMDSFWLEAEDELAEGAFYDEHSLNGQRAARILCMGYGSNPEKFADWIDPDRLPEERAESCAEEYQRMAKGWETLLAPHVVE